jgi:hypothetical protein
MGVLMALLAIALHGAALVRFHRSPSVPRTGSSAAARFWLVLAAAVTLIVAAASASDALAQSVLAPPLPSDCEIEEPDSVQISWDGPCDAGTWLLDTELGCRMWDWHPDPTDSAAWSGACPAGQKAGGGVLQWYEHGHPIDRFEGQFVAGRRQGFGRYFWNEAEWFIGFYKDGIPDGPGTAVIAGDAFYGIWQRGCLRRNDKVVAINVSRSSCETLPAVSSVCRGSCT